MPYTEAKPQTWRAVALLDDRGERLLYLGRSSRQVRDGYAVAFAEVLEEEERHHVRAIILERWDGAADAGRWTHQTDLAVPYRGQVTRSA